LDATQVESEDQVGQQAEQTEQQEATEQTEQTTPAEEGQEPAQPERSATEEAAEQATGDAVEASPIRVITIPMPETCLTKVELLLQKPAEDPRGWWRPGYSVSRSYSCSPHPNAYMEKPLPANEEDGYAALGDAIAYAIDSADMWLGTNSADEDQHAAEAGNALDAWITEFDSNTATESMFDDATDQEKNQEADGPAEETPPATVCQECCCPAGDVKVEISNQPPAGATFVVTPEAQKAKAYDDRKRELEERIGRLAIEEENLKVAMKLNRESRAECVDALKKHIFVGVKKLPLFDQQPKPVQSTPTAEQPTPKPAIAAEPKSELPEQVPALPEGAVEARTIRLLADLVDGEVEIGKTGDTVTAFAGAPWGLFILYGDGGGERWILGNDEYEEIQEQAQPTDEPAGDQPQADECIRGGQHEPDAEGACRKCHEPGVGPVAAVEPGSEPWRSTRMADLEGLTEKIVEVLDNHTIYTLGDWVDWPAKNPGLEYTQLKGITEKRYEKIMDAVTKATT
jgi:hypothetical protein